jgi:hypothetical protein
MLKLTKREIQKNNTHYKGGMININLEVLKKHVKLRHNCIIIPNKIIRYFIDVQKRAKFLGVISSHVQIPKPIFFLTCTLQREKGVISFHVQKILLLFSI